MFEKNIKLKCKEWSYININFLGGALEVGGSSILVKINNKNILLDAGIRQSASKDSVPNFRDVQTIYFYH